MSHAESMVFLLQNLDFESWVAFIDADVRSGLPSCALTSLPGETYRWRYAMRECQLHLVTDGFASLLFLRRSGRWPVVERKPAAIEISEKTHEDVGRDILAWLRS